MVVLYMLIGAALCAGTVFSCAWRSAENGDGRHLEKFNGHLSPDCAIVILPFEGDEENPQLASRVRQSFYSHFSPKKYHDIELRDIDSMLETLDVFSRQQWRSLTAQELGRCFNADYLIYGKVLRTRRLFFVFYSQIALHIEIRLVDARRGTTLWQGDLEKRLQSGDVPLHPLTLVSAAVRTGVEAGDERMQDLIERTCRELAESFPEPAAGAKNMLPVEIQVGSFGSPERARQMADSLRHRGYEVRVEPVRIKGADWHRVIIGPYAEQTARRARQQLTDDAAARPVLLYAR